MFLRNLLFVLLILVPFTEKLTRKAGFEINILSEVLSLSVFLAVISIYGFRKRANDLVIVVITFVLYCCFLVVWRQLYPLGFFQVIIYTQFFFFFLYFHSLNEETKKRTLISLKNIMTIFVVISGFIAIYEAIDHSSYRKLLGVHSVKRGINYFYLISFFGSGPSLAIFLFLYVLVWHYVHYALKVVIRRRDILILVLSVALAILTFSRKEVLFIFLFLIFFPYPTRNQLNKWFKRAIFFFSVFLGLSVYYLTFFESANSNLFDEKYVRWQIIEKASEISADYFPLGSGPGTFGSKTSLVMDHVYKAYDVGEAILGYKVLNNRGPIYDAFLFSFFTEIGIGILIFFFFIYKLFEAKTILNTEYSRFSKNFLIFFTIILSFFVPLFTNSFGYIIMALAGLLTANISIFKFRRWYAKN